VKNTGFVSRPYVRYNVLSILEMSHQDHCNVYYDKRLRIPKGKSEVDNLEKLATQSTQDVDKQSNICWTPQICGVFISDRNLFIFC